MAKKALVVDDSVTMRKMVTMSLEQNGFEVVSAENGVDALNKANSPIDVMVVDINMPEMDGITLIRKLREKPTYAKTPILVLTTEGGEDTKQAGREAGANGWLVKPFNPEVLIKAINKVCGSAA